VASASLAAPERKDRNSGVLNQIGVRDKQNPYIMAVLWWPLFVVVVLILPPSYHLATPSSGNGQLRRLWLQDHCSAGICTNVVIGDVGSPNNGMQECRKPSI